MARIVRAAVAGVVVVIVQAPVGRGVAGWCGNSQLTTPPRLAWILSAARKRVVAGLLVGSSYSENRHGSSPQFASPSGRLTCRSGFRAQARHAAGRPTESL